MHTARLIGILMATILSAPAATALRPEVAARIDSLFAGFDHPNAPGASVMVIHHGKPVFAKGYGLANLDTKTPCTTNTNFRLASVTKQFTAMAVMILVERKALSLDESLVAFFPEFPEYGRAITVRQLLTHTSGLIDYEDVIPEGTTIPVLDQDVLRLLIATELKRRAANDAATNRPAASAATYFPPGTQYRYSNTAYALLALIVEVRSGQTFARFLRENIFEPLKMTHTLAYEQGYAPAPNRAFGHSLKSNVWQRTDQSLTSSVLGDGGVYSSVSDLFKWDQALYKARLVSAPMLRVAFSPLTPTDKPGRGYGFGWYVTTYRGLKEIYHSGETIGFRTRIVRYPEKKFTVIILANRADAKLEDFPHRIVDLVLPASQ